jgi:hypothetical protein
MNVNLFQQAPNTLPSFQELEQMHIEDLVEELGDIREEIGYYRRLRTKPLPLPTLDLLDNLIHLKKRELGLLRTEIERIRNDKTTDTARTGTVSRPRQGDFQF